MGFRNWLQAALALLIVTTATAQAGSGGPAAGGQGSGGQGSGGQSSGGQGSGTSTTTCPKKQARHVAERVTPHGELPCTGGSISFGGLTVSTPSSACPIFATHQQQHEVEVDAPTQTMVEVVGQASTWIYYFACESDWLLIIPWGSSCAISRTVTGSDNPRFRTISCEAGINP